MLSEFVIDFDKSNLMMRFYYYFIIILFMPQQFIYYNFDIWTNQVCKKGVSDDV